MPIRSILISAADGLDRLALPPTARPDAVMLDLAAKEPSEALIGAVAAMTRAGTALWIRLPPPDEAPVAERLAAARRLSPAAYALSKTETAADVEHLGALLATEEAEAGLPDGTLKIVAMVETAGALFETHRAARASPRLAALGWDGEALARDLGADEDREFDGRWIDPLQTARTLALAACADAGLPAIDSPFANVDATTFRREAKSASRDGFSAKFALDAEQVAIVEAVFGAGR